MRLLERRSFDIDLRSDNAILLAVLFSDIRRSVNKYCDNHAEQGCKPEADAGYFDPYTGRPTKKLLNFAYFYRLVE